MATNCTIAAIMKDKRVGIIYCHFDGHHAGAVLNEHYVDQDKIDSLINLGCIQYLDQSIEKPEGHSLNHRVDGYTVFYGRDDGSEHDQAKFDKTYPDALWKFGMKEIRRIRFHYFWNGQEWLCVTHPN